MQGNQKGMFSTRTQNTSFTTTVGTFTIDSKGEGLSSKRKGVMNTTLSIGLIRFLSLTNKISAKNCFVFHYVTR